MIYAVVRKSIVKNIVDAEPSVPFGILFPDHEVMAVTPDSGLPHIGLGAQGGKFQEFASWTFDKSLGEWVAPTPSPAGDFFWEESQRAWVQIILEADLELDVAVDNQGTTPTELSI